MPISGVSGPSDFNTEVLVKAKEQQQIEGQAAVKLIEESGAARAPETQRIKHPNSTLSVIA